MFIFLHLPKTGGTSFRFIVENSFGLSHCHTGHTRKKIFSEADLRFAQRFFPSLRSLAGHNLIEPTRLPLAGGFFTTFLREPVARVISHYQDSVLRGGNSLNFSDSLQADKRLSNLQVRWIAGEDNLEKAKQLISQYGFVGLTEKFDLSVHVLGRLCPDKLNLRYRKYVIPKDDKIKKALEADPELLNLARQKNLLDLELYSFVEREIFPNLCREAGVSPRDAIPAYSTYSNDWKWNYLCGRFYNKIFREVYSRFGSGREEAQRFGERKAG